MEPMKTRSALFILLFLGNFLNGQEKIGVKKILFEPENISTQHVEYGATFTHDGNEMYFARSEQEWGKGTMTSTIYHAFLKGDKWSTPKIASFSGTYNDSDPHITSDGKTLYFVSSRPSTENTPSSDIWSIKKNRDGSWAKPERMPNPINSEKREYSPVTDAAGNLYFASDRSGGYGQGDLYVVPKNEGKPLNLGNTLNSATGEWNLGVSADGNTLIFEASQRQENVSPYGDLYISFKQNNAWTIPQNLVELNTSGSDLYPFFKGSEQLFFTSSDSLKSGNTNIYKVSFGAIRKKYQGTARQPSLNEKCLTNNSFEDRYASYSPDGENILFESDRDGTWEIYMMDKDGQNPQQLTMGDWDNRRPSWHPSGKKILFESNRNGTQELFVLNIKNKKTKKLFGTQGKGDPIFASYSPNGKTVATSLQISDHKSNIVLLSAKGKIIKWLTQNEKRNYYPKWSKNGKEIVYFSRKDTDNEDDEIYRNNITTGADMRLTSWLKHNFCPSWSNNDKKVVYVTSMEGTRPEIYMMDADGNNPIRLTHNENGETLPNWHPTQDKILITAYRNGNYEICELKL